MDNQIIFGVTDEQSGYKDEILLTNMSNRHGCITGATGTGKTVSLQKLAESFSKKGVPVFLADIKGDLSGIAKTAVPTDKLKARLEKHHLPTPDWSACPVVFWDVFGQEGFPVRATISDMGPLLLSRLLQLNDTQEGVLNAVFSIADDNGLLLLWAITPHSSERSTATSQWHLSEPFKEVCWYWKIRAEISSSVNRCSIFTI